MFINFVLFLFLVDPSAPGGAAYDRDTRLPQRVLCLQFSRVLSILLSCRLSMMAMERANWKLINKLFICKFEIIQMVS
jgi:hypothetical protein